MTPDTFTTTPADAARYEARHATDDDRDTDDPGVVVVAGRGCCVGGACRELHPWAMNQKEHAHAC